METDESLRRIHPMSFWFLLVLFLFLLVHPTNQRKIGVPSFSGRRQLLSQSMTNHSLRTTSGTPTPSNQFEEGKHEVPSGPNPINNR